MDEIKEWIIPIIIAAIFWFGIDACNNKSNKKEKAAPVYMEWEPTDVSQTTYTSTSNNSSSNAWDPVEETEPKYTYSYSYSYSIGGSNSYEEDEYDDYEETSSCLDGEIVYEGNDDYYIVETRSGYTILERLSGTFLHDGDRIRGKLHNYGITYIIRKNTNNETCVYIEECMISYDRAIEWMSGHSHL